MQAVVQESRWCAAVGRSCLGAGCCGRRRRSGLRCAASLVCTAQQQRTLGLGLLGHALRTGLGLLGHLDILRMGGHSITFARRNPVATARLATCSANCCEQNSATSFSTPPSKSPHSPPKNPWPPSHAPHLLVHNLGAALLVLAAALLALALAGLRSRAGEAGANECSSPSSAASNAQPSVLDTVQWAIQQGAHQAAACQHRTSQGCGTGPSPGPCPHLEVGILLILAVAVGMDACQACRRRGSKGARKLRGGRGQQPRPRACGLHLRFKSSQAPRGKGRNHTLMCNPEGREKQQGTAHLRPRRRPPALHTR